MSVINTSNLVQFQKEARNLLTEREGVPRRTNDSVPVADRDRSASDKQMLKRSLIPPVYKKGNSSLLTSCCAAVWLHCSRSRAWRIRCPPEMR
jgi:hypothetical protein